MVGAVLGVRPHRALPALRGAEGKDILSLPTKYNNKINLFLSAVIHTPHPYPCVRPLEMPTHGVTPPGQSRARLSTQPRARGGRAGTGRGDGDRVGPAGLRPLVPALPARVSGKQSC